LNVIGIFEVVKHYSRIKKIFNNTISEIKKINPDKIVLIDYPGFNLRLAKKLSALNIDITYFILPQVWAWKESRAKTLQQYCNKLISIIPFEKKWFSQKNITVHYAGHPLSELSDLTFDRGSFCQRHGIPEENKIIILMPGSRSVEIKRHWKIFEKAVQNLRKQHQNLSFVLLEGENVSISSSVNLVKIKENQYEAIGIADAAIVCSGTATLETAMLRCPMIVCYKLSWPTWILAQMLSKVKYLSLVNLIAEDRVVDEYLQNKMNAKNLASGVNNLFKNENRDTVVEKYKRLIEKLKTNENPYTSAARYIYD
jgi:lipid-A-disaccharide synthase